MNIIIIKYNAGNVQSVMYALERLGVQAQLTDDHDIIKSADKIIFPGVGEASSTMRYLKERRMDQLIPSLTQPVLGICLGMQLMCSFSEENNTDCLGIFDHHVRKFPMQDLKVPHMGWNTIEKLTSPIMRNLGEEPYVYFVHSYFVEKGPYTIAETEYAVRFSSALHKDNFYGTQFHPEKSGKTGATILKNFLEKT